MYNPLCNINGKVAERGFQSTATKEDEIADPALVSVNDMNCEGENGYSIFSRCYVNFHTVPTKSTLPYVSVGKAKLCRSRVIARQRQRRDFANKSPKIYRLDFDMNNHYQ